ncbi:MAG: hypothetical protein MUC89_15475 [Acetobacteraceae bacterium]|jgi:hypothetical protein|nr:hypothetical protein [Acetobacteraceae bacterium]
MAEHGSTAATNPAAEAAFVKDRQAMLGSFVTFSTYSIVAIVVLLILMAIFLI